VRALPRERYLPNGPGNAGGEPGRQDSIHYSDRQVKMKILLWAIVIIFLIGLAVVTGFFKLIF